MSEALGSRRALHRNRLLCRPRLELGVSLPYAILKSIRPRRDQLHNRRLQVNRRVSLKAISASAPVMKQSFNDDGARRCRLPAPVSTGLIRNHPRDGGRDRRVAKSQTYIGQAVWASKPVPQDPKGREDREADADRSLALWRGHARIARSGTLDGAVVGRPRRRGVGRPVARRRHPTALRLRLGREHLRRLRKALLVLPLPVVRQAPRAVPPRARADSVSVRLLRRPLGHGLGIGPWGLRGHEEESGTFKFRAEPAVIDPDFAACVGRTPLETERAGWFDAEDFP